jgi:hypothetical protein
VTDPSDVRGLPGLVALDAFAVLDGRRRGSSVQLDETYFDGQLAATRTYGADDAFESRRRIVRESKRVYDETRIEIDSITETNLMDASEQFRGILRQLPEIELLRQGFPGTCFVVPEWLRRPTGVEFGARVYFFRDGDAPDPDEVIRENVAAVVSDDRPAFERYQGRLHGYPACCIEYFHERDDDPPPEWRAMEPLLDCIDEDALRGDAEPASVEAVLGDPFAHEHVHAFFAREFFPEPGCETARDRGRDVRDGLAAAFPPTLVRDYFRINVGWNYLVARAVREGGGGRPEPGALGPEHRLFYLPLAAVLSVDRYG